MLLSLHASAGDENLNFLSDTPSVALDIYKKVLHIASMKLSNRHDSASARRLAA